MLMSWPLSALVAGVKIGVGQPVRFAQARRQRDAAHRSRGHVFLPARSRQIAARHALDRHRVSSCAPASSARRACRHAVATRPDTRARLPTGNDSATMSVVRSNQNAESCVRTLPLSGMPEPST